MRRYNEITLSMAIASVFTLFIGGCGRPVVRDRSPKIRVTDTIGSLTETFFVDAINVEGYGVVGALAGTGSPECPPNIKSYLKRYILSRPSGEKIDLDAFLKSRDTAVVHLSGVMSAPLHQKDRFDVKVEALAGTQSRSLQGGWLYSAELKRMHTFGISTRCLAKVKGPVFMDTVGAPVSNKRTGYILGGGEVRDRYHMRLSLLKPDFFTARVISDTINARFGDSTARAASAGVIELTPPIEYSTDKNRFISIVHAMYLVSNQQLEEERTQLYAERLANSENKYASEVALEALGNASLARVHALLNSADQEVRFRAARCILNLGDHSGAAVLRAIALDRSSKYRIEALEALTAGANRMETAGTCRQLLQDEDFSIRLAAYEQLRKLDDVTVSQELIGGRFYLEQIVRSRRQEVYVSRSGLPRIVLFGSPITCRENIFVRSPNGEVTINAPAGQKYVTLIRKLRNAPDAVKLQSSFVLSDIIRKLCEEPLEKKGVLVRSGLNVSYAQVIAIIKQLCDTAVAPVAFHAGKLPEIK